MSRHLKEFSPTPRIKQTEVNLEITGDPNVCSNKTLSIFGKISPVRRSCYFPDFRMLNDPELFLTFV